MSRLILPNKWTSQPQYPALLDLGNPLAQICVGAYLPANNNLKTGGPSLIVSNFGVGYKFLRTSSQHITIPLTSPISLTSSGATLIGIFNSTDIAAGQCAFALTDGGSHFSVLPRGDLADDPISAASWNSGASSFRQFKGPSYASGVNYVVAITTDTAGNFDIYLDGVLQSGSYTNSGTIPSVSMTKLEIGASNGTGDFLSGSVFSALAFKGRLNQQEIKSLSDNPWQIFKAPQRRIWVAGAGGLTLSPSLYVDPDTFYSPTVSPGAVTLSPSLFTDSDTFYAATVTPGAITLSPDLVVDADTFYSATVMPGGVNLAPTLLSSTNTFYSPTVSTGSVNISPALFVDADTFYSPAVSLDGSPQTLTPGLFVDSDTFYSATVAAGGVTLNPSLFVDADTFYIPTVSLDGAPQNLTPSLYVDSDTFYSPVVSSSGSQNLLPSLFVDADIFYSASMVNGGFAKRGEYENDQSARRTHIQESTRSNIQTSRRR